MIIPGILESSFEEALKKVQLVENNTKLIQIDIADGILVDGKTFQDIEKLGTLSTPTKFELHLMVKEPFKYVQKKIQNITSAIAHVEANDTFEFIALCKEHGYKTGLCINTETEMPKLYPYLKNIDYVQFMGVTPGAQGRTFKKEVVNKLKGFKDNYPNIRTQIDGGVGKSQLGLVLKSGVDDIVIGSTIFSSENPVETLKELQKSVEGFA